MLPLFLEKLLVVEGWQVGVQGIVLLLIRLLVYVEKLLELQVMGLRSFSGESWAFCIAHFLYGLPISRSRGHFLTHSTTLWVVWSACGLALIPVLSIAIHQMRPKERIALGAPPDPFLEFPLLLAIRFGLVHNLLELGSTFEHVQWCDCFRAGVREVFAIVVIGSQGAAAEVGWRPGSG